MTGILTKTIPTGETLTLFFGRMPNFSNFKITLFEIDDHWFNCSEHYFQYQKALFFNDYEIAVLIKASIHPAEQKRLGRTVNNFNADVWEEVRMSVMKKACIAKFTQNLEARNELIASNDSILAEASPWDKIWGIGLAIWDKKALDPNEWNGQNLMGKVLMEVREILLTESYISY